MESQDFEFEKFLVTEAVSLTFHGFDFVVGAFQGAGGDRVIIVGQDAPAIEGQSFGEFNQHGNAGSRSPVHPILEDGGGGGLICLEPDLPQVLFQVVGQGQGLIELQRGGQPFGFPAVGIEIFRVFQEQPASALEHLLMHAVGGFVVELAPQVREAIVIEFDDREVVEDMDRVGQMSKHGTDIGRRQIGGHRPRYAPFAV